MPTAPITWHPGPTPEAPRTVDRPLPASPPWARLLSARERDVLHCLARGLSNAEIAAELVVSLPTVKTHVARLLHKVRARDRLQLVVEAYQSGYVRPLPAQASAVVIEHPRAVAGRPSGLARHAV